MCALNSSSLSESFDGYDVVVKYIFIDLLLIEGWLSLQIVEYSTPTLVATFLKF